MNTRNILSTLAILSVAAIASTGASAAQQSGGRDGYGPGITYAQKAAPSGVLSLALVDNDPMGGPGIVVQNAPTANAGQTDRFGDFDIVADYPSSERNGR